jgi:outer membrane protein TolC
MFKIKFLSLLFLVTVVNASNLLTLSEALDILKSENLGIKSATLKVDSAKLDIDSASGNHWGKLDFIQDYANSNDAGNVFGFKLTSREATFGDFGFSEFDTTNPNILSVAPEVLNYPDARNFFQSKLKYEIPLFTGFQISSYVEIMKSMAKMKGLEKEQVVNEKIYQLRKSYYDMALLRNSVKNLNKILSNIETLQKMTTRMVEVGYAKKVDLLEVQAKKGNVQRLLLQMQSNQKLLLHYISFLLNSKVDNIIAPDSDIAIPIYSDKYILENNLDIQRASTGLEIRKDMIDVSKSSYYPTIGAFGEIATADDTFLGDANEHKAYTIGARLTWNIFSGGIDNAKIEKSKLQHLETQIDLNYAKQGIALKVAKIRTEIETFDLEIISLKKELYLADEIYKNYAGRYREKLSSMSDVIIKQSEQIQKILQLQEAKNKRNERIFALEKLANGEQI